MIAEPPRSAVDAAVEQAKRSPCGKSKRGVVVITADGTIFGRGFNGMPGNVTCAAEVLCRYDGAPRRPLGPADLDGSLVAEDLDLPPPGLIADAEICRSVCARRCVHAEVRAIRGALSAWQLGRVGIAPGTLHHALELVHVKVIDGGLVPSGGPSCAECAREVLDVGLGIVWLFHADGWRGYSAGDFYRLSLAAAGLPVDR